MRCVLCVDCDCQKTLLTRVQRMYGLTALACLFSFDMPVYYTLHGDTGPKAYHTTHKKREITMIDVYLR